MKKAFTIIELIFIIVILGILAGIALPKLAATRDDALVSVCSSNIETLVKDIQSLAVTQGNNLPNVNDINQISEVVLHSDDTHKSRSLSISGAGKTMTKDFFYKFNCGRKNVSGQEPSVYIGFFNITYLDQNQKATVTLSVNGKKIFGPAMIKNNESFIYVIDSNSTYNIDKLLQKRLQDMGILNQKIMLSSSRVVY